MSASNRRRLLGGAAALLAAAGLAPAVAQQPGSRLTREFVQAAAQSDQFEIMEARVVLAQSRDPQTRAFAQQMIDAHEETTPALQRATSQSGLEPPPESLGDDQARLLGALQSLSDSDLDRAYAIHQAIAHRGTLTVEQGYAGRGDAPAVRQAAAAAVPLVSRHLAMAERMRSQSERR